MFETFQVDSLSFHEAIIAPAFSDLVADSPIGYTGYLNEFTLMDNVVGSRPIVDIRRVQNIMQRRDASCDFIYKRIMGGSTRKVSTDEVYGGAQFCRNEFYQGCLKDFRNGDPLFGSKILPWFQKAMSIDLVTNSYFGRADRVGSPSDVYSANVFDGVFEWLKFYTNSSLIPSAQALAISNGYDFTGTPANAYNLLKQMYDAQPVLMGTFTDAEKAFYVSKEIAAGYEDYLIATGSGIGNIQFLQNGVKRLFYKGIEILVQPLWTPVITQIKGSVGYAAVLTIRGNFVFATDKNYGEGEDGATALEVWYEKKEAKWYYRMFLKAGTQIALPEYVVYALSSWN